MISLSLGLSSFVFLVETCIYLVNSAIVLKQDWAVHCFLCTYLVSTGAELRGRSSLICNLTDSSISSAAA